MSKGKDLINSIKYGLYRMLTKKIHKITLTSNHVQWLSVTDSLVVCFVCSIPFL